MPRNGIGADDVSWLLRKVKMSGCIAFVFSTQAEIETEKIRVSMFSRKIIDYAPLGFKLWEEE